MTDAHAHVPRPILAIVFDMDDTLYPERQYVRSGYRAVAAALGGKGHEADALADWMWRRFCAGQAAGMFNALDDAFDLGLDDARIAELVQLYRDHTPTLQPDDQALRLLRHLHGKVKLGLLSDGFLPAQQYKLDALGLAPWFDAVLFTETLGRECWKPSPAGYEHLRLRLNVPHDACAYVADNPSKDFVAPNALGWRTVQWRRDGQVHADKPAPAGGEPQAIAWSACEVLDALGFDAAEFVEEAGT